MWKGWIGPPMSSPGDIWGEISMGCLFVSAPCRTCFSKFFMMLSAPEGPRMNMSGEYPRLHSMTSACSVLPLAGMFGTTAMIPSPLGTPRQAHRLACNCRISLHTSSGWLMYLCSHTLKSTKAGSLHSFLAVLASFNSVSIVCQAISGSNAMAGATPPTPPHSNTTGAAVLTRNGMHGVH